MSFYIFSYHTHYHGYNYNRCLLHFFDKKQYLSVSNYWLFSIYVCETKFNIIIILFISLCKTTTKHTTRAFQVSHTHFYSSSFIISTINNTKLMYNVISFRPKFLIKKLVIIIFFKKNQNFLFIQCK